MLYRFVEQQKADGFPVERICEIAWVSRAAYYDWKAHRIEAWYNRRRISSVLGYQSPIEWESNYRHTTNTMAA